MTGPRTIFVDGYNVIRNTTALAQVERGSLAAGRHALLARLAGKYRHTPHRVVVVFDGDTRTESAQPYPGLSRGRVIFTCANDTADAVIIRLAAEARREGLDVTVISDDLEVRLGAGAYGAATARVGDLQRRMDEAPRLLRKRFTHQATVKRILDGDGDELPGQRSKGNSRKAPRKRGQPQRESPL